MEILVIYAFQFILQTSVPTKIFLCLELHFLLHTYWEIDGTRFSIYVANCLLDYDLKIIFSYLPLYGFLSRQTSSKGKAFHIIKINNAMPVITLLQILSFYDEMIT